MEEWSWVQSEREKKQNKFQNNMPSMRAVFKITPSIMYGVYRRPRNLGNSQPQSCNPARVKQACEKDKLKHLPFCFSELFCF